MKKADIEKLPYELLKCTTEEEIKIRLNKIAARWPPRLWRRFILPEKKSSGNIFRDSVLLSYHTKQLNTESPTAYEKNSIFRRLLQSDL